MAESVPVDSASGVPPAREIPSTFVESFRSWSAPMARDLRCIFDRFSRWAAGEKEAASSEERLLRYLFRVPPPVPSSAYSTPGDCPSSDPGHRYRPAPPMGL